MEMGGYYHGFHHEVTPNYIKSGFDLGHHGLVDQEHASQSDLGQYFCREIDIYLYQGGCGTSSGADFGGF